MTALVLLYTLSGQISIQPEDFIYLNKELLQISFYSAISWFCQMDPEHDRQISDHVLRMHRYRANGEQDGDGVCLLSLSD